MNICVDKCPKCYAKLYKDSKFCEVCGCNLQVAFREEAAFNEKTEIIENPI